MPDEISDAGHCILVNNENTRGPVGSTVQDLLEILGMTERRVAIALNRDVVPRSNYPAIVLAAEDRIEILEAVGGG